MYTSEENKFKKWFGRPELEMTLFSLTSLRLGLVFSNFLMTLLALLFIIFLTNTGIVHMMGLNTLSFQSSKTSSG
jgi:hypothetical protein